METVRQFLVFLAEQLGYVVVWHAVTHVPHDVDHLTSQEQQIHVVCMHWLAVFLLCHLLVSCRPSTSALAALRRWTEQLTR